MSSIVNVSTDFVLEAVKKIAPMSVLFPALGAGVSYVAYAGDRKVSSWPWEIGVAILLACILGLFAVYLKARRTNELWACGVIVAIGVFAVYYFFWCFRLFFLLSVCANADDCALIGIGRRCWADRMVATCVAEECATYYREDVLCGEGFCGG